MLWRSNDAYFQNAYTLFSNDRYVAILHETPCNMTKLAESATKAIYKPMKILRPNNEIK
jgi:hypothetical protein